jgi:hypothetical protein
VEGGIGRLRRRQRLVEQRNAVARPWWLWLLRWLRPAAPNAPAANAIDSAATAAATTVTRARLEIRMTGTPVVWVTSLDAHKGQK